MLPISWISSTVLGAWLGSFLGEPERLGADFAFTALFIGLIAGFWSGRATGFVIAASGATSASTYLVAGPPWHVAAGALAGIALAWATPGPARAA
jgi:predicted branched-subunit amino acid permease